MLWQINFFSTVMDKSEFKQTIYTEIADMVKAMANPHRLEIIDLLANGEKTVEQIATETRISIANASQHLQNLKKARLVKIRRLKNYRLYSLTNIYVYAIWKTLREFARLQIPEIDKVGDDYRRLNNATVVSLNELEKYKPYLLVDVRPNEEFENGHFDEAINIPVSQLISNLNQLPKDKYIITYCRGPFCTFADQALEILINSGFKAARLEEAFVDVTR